MYFGSGILLALAAQSVTASRRIPARRTYETHDYYVLEHNPKHGLSPHECAAALGAQLVEQAGELQNHYLVSVEKSLHNPSQPRGLEQRSSDRVVAAFNSLRKRAALPHSTQPHSKRLSSSIRSLEPQIPRQRVKRGSIGVTTPGNAILNEVIESLQIHDPLFPSQWHIVNQELPEHMMNVTGVWKEGITGKGVISAIVDDGLDYESQDLAENFDAEGSYDFNDHVPLPKPVLWDDHHGTRCAGEIAAAKNDVCGVGLAYESKVAGIRILSGAISDVDEAAALNLGFQKTALYSCSWGPPDDGKSMDGPSMLIQKAVLNGINNGRDGKGSVFVFASGNGAGQGDQCNFDGYTNSIYSVTVGAVDWKGMHPYYSEACAANMIVTYSSGATKHIVTTDVGATACSSAHGGTSAAAPLAVGVFALALEARPDLSWRDIQHLCVRSAIHINPDDPDWEKTAAGRPYSYKYGYGRLDAYNFVAMARNWELVKPQAWLEIPTMTLADADMIDGVMKGGISITSEGVSSSTKITKEMLKDKNFEKLEHITVKVWISHTKRGDVEVALISPNGIKSMLAGARQYDEDKGGFVGWQFMTLKHWDEDAEGEWTLKVNDMGKEEHNGSFLGWGMTLWGSSIDASKAVKFQLPDVEEEDHALPPHPSATQDEDKTKTHPKPTDHLSTDHGLLDGETTKAAFQSGTSTDEIPDTTDLPIAEDEGIFDHMYDLLSNQTWLVAAFGVVALFGIGTGIFFYRRRQQHLQKRSAYAALSGADDIGMTDQDASARGALLGGHRRGGEGRTKELYDAFGVLSDEDELSDDDDGVGGGYDAGGARGVQYHAGFLDDDGPPTATTPGRDGVRYRDEPDNAGSERQGLSGHGSRTGSDGSGYDSWQDASEGRS